MTDAPIRQAVPEYSMCRNCAKILQSCKEYKIRKAIENGYVVIERCSGFEDYREIEPKEIDKAMEGGDAE